MKLTYYGKSSFLVDVQGKKILFDPFITYNELAKNVDINKIEPHYIFLSHGHSDHIADCVTVAKQTNALVVAAFEIHEWLNNQGVNNTHPIKKRRQLNLRKQERLYYCRQLGKG